MTDAAGFIYVMPDLARQPAFRKVVDTLINTLMHKLGDTLHSVYLYGSVARGEAITGISDHDLCLILTRKSDQGGNCRNNSPMERFFRSLKNEWVPITGYVRCRDATHIISDYIVEYYSTLRHREHNGGYHQTNRKTDAAQTLTQWPVVVDHYRFDFSI